MALRTTYLAKCYLYYCFVIFESLVLNNRQLTVMSQSSQRQLQFTEVILFICLNSSVHTDGHAKITGRLREGTNSWKNYLIQCQNDYRHVSIGSVLHICKHNQ